VSLPLQPSAHRREAAERPAVHVAEIRRQEPRSRSKAGKLAVAARCPSQRIAALAWLRQDAAREEGRAKRRDREVRAGQKNVGAKARGTYGCLRAGSLGAVGLGRGHGLADLFCLRAIVRELSCLRATASAAREAAPLRLLGQDAGHPASRREEARAAATPVRTGSTRR
jgi:hypothetical protein